MTIKELILENDNFAHSEEAFEIYKESCELNVLNAWIECQEHKAFTNCDMFTEADDNALSAAKEKAEAKEEALYKKIWDKIKTTASKVWDAILKLIDKILCTFGAIRTPVLSDEQKKALLNGEDVFGATDIINEIVSGYKRIPYITDDSFTALGDRGTRKLANALAGKDASNIKKMAALQVAVWLTGSTDLILPPILFGGNTVIKSAAIAAKKELYFKKMIERFGKETDPAKFVSEYDAFERVGSDDFDKIRNNIKELRNGIRDIQFESTDALMNKGLDKVIKIMNRDLKITHIAILNQIKFESVIDLIENDLNKRNDRKN